MQEGRRFSSPCIPAEQPRCHIIYTGQLMLPVLGWGLEVFFVFCFVLLFLVGCFPPSFLYKAISKPLLLLKETWL